MKYIVKNRNLLILFTSTFLFFLNEALLLPTLPVHLASIGYSHTRIGIVLGAFALGVLLFRPLSGYVTDRKSRRLALIIGVAVFFIAPVFYFFSDHFIYLIVIRFFHGLGITFYTTAMPAFVTDVAPEHQRGEIMGHMSSASTLSFTCGPLLGIAIYSGFGFEGLLLACIVAGGVNLGVVLILREEYAGARKTDRIAYRAVIFKRSILVSSFITLIHAVIFGTIMTFLPVLINEMPDLNVGFFFLAESVTIIACRIFTAHLVDRVGRGPAFVYSFCIILVSVFLVSGITTYAGLVLIGALFGCGAALGPPALAAYIADETDQKARGTAFGFYYGAFDTGVIVAGLIMGVIADLTSLRDMFVILSLTGVGCLVVFVLMIKDSIGDALKWSLTGK
ncbi:MAG: MFS transporter [Desulfobacterales bacterium]|nr:MFS transporter [Desulfobacterales bacterium]